MSRSFKKFGGYKDHNKGMKEIANRRYRRRSLDDTQIPHKKYTNSYDICDYKCLVVQGRANADYKAYMK